MAQPVARSKVRSRKDGSAVPLDDLDRKVLNLMQGQFPLAPRPYAAVAEKAEVTEAEVMARVQRLLDEQPRVQRMPGQRPLAGQVRIGVGTGARIAAPRQLGQPASVRGAEPGLRARADPPDVGKPSLQQHDQHGGDDGRRRPASVTVPSHARIVQRARAQRNGSRPNRDAVVVSP